MSRIKYWKLSAKELENVEYNTDKVLTWDIKCIKEPEESAKFIGIFMYKNGTPYDYGVIKGIAYYHNHIMDNEINDITKFLKNKYGGNELKKGSRVLLKDSKEFYDATEIASLSNEIEKKFNTKNVITIEFQNMNDKEKKMIGLPENKLLPIPSK